MFLKAREALLSQRNAYHLALIPGTRYPAPGAYSASMLVSGEVELAVQQIPELLFMNGIDVVGPLPGDLQVITIFAAGVPASAKEPNAARALITYLRSPEAVTIIKAKGLDPG
jgi:molybdate transport system substrate-binding protein